MQHQGHKSHSSEKSNTEGTGREDTNPSQESDSTTTAPQSFREGPVAKAIETQTAKLPSDTFLWSAAGVGAVSILFKTFGRNHAAQFVSNWVAPILLLGVYNKIVKLMGSDQQSSPQNVGPEAPSAA